MKKDNQWDPGGQETLSFIWVGEILEFHEYIPIYEEILCMPISSSLCPPSPSALQSSTDLSSYLYPCGFSS